MRLQVFQACHNLADFFRDARFFPCAVWTKRWKHNCCYLQKTHIEKSKL